MLIIEYSLVSGLVVYWVVCWCSKLLGDLVGVL